MLYLFSLLCFVLPCHSLDPHNIQINCEEDLAVQDVRNHARQLPPGYNGDFDSIPTCLSMYTINWATPDCQAHRKAYFNDQTWRAWFGVSHLSDWRRFYGFSCLNETADPDLIEGDYLRDYGAAPRQLFFRAVYQTSKSRYRHGTHLRVAPDTAQLSHGKTTHHGRSQAGQHEGTTTARPEGLAEETGSGEPSTNDLSRGSTADASTQDQFSSLQDTTQNDFTDYPDLQSQSLPGYPFGDTVYPGTHTPFRLSPTDDFIKTVFTHTNFTQDVDQQFQLRLPAGCANESLETLCHAGAGRVRPRLWTVFATCPRQHGPRNCGSYIDQAALTLWTLHLPFERGDPRLYPGDLEIQVRSDSADPPPTPRPDPDHAVQPETRTTDSPAIHPESREMDRVRQEPVSTTPAPSPTPSHSLGSDASVPDDGPTPSTLPGHPTESSPRTYQDIGAAVLDELGVPHLKKIHIQRQPRSVPTNPSRHSIAQFKAYDCSEPQQIQPVQMSHILNCPLPHGKTADQHFQRSVPANYQILQSSGFRPTWAHKVHLVRSEIPLLCAMNSHHALGVEGLEFSRPHRLSFLQLSRLLDTWRYSPSDSVNPFKEMRIQENTTYHFSYVATGSVHSENNNDYNCVGAKRHFKALNQNTAQDHFGWLVYRYEQLAIERVPVAISETGSVTDLSTNEVLSCHSRANSADPDFCTDTSLAAYRVHPPPNCDSILLRQVQGEVHYFTDENDTTIRIFTSTDGSMTHFTLGKQLTLCGQIVHSTEYPDLFVLDLASVHSLQPYRPADPKSISLTSYFNSKIAFAYKESVAFAKNLYFLAQHDLCISQQATSSIRYAHAAAQQESLNQGTTIRLGDNIFATPSGEAYYRFVCRPINVTAINADTCFGAIPVKLSSDDDHFYRKATGLPLQVPGVLNMTSQERREVLFGTVDTTKKYQYFLEPLTHRLITAAPSQPCSPLPALWLNALGDWISASPSIKRPLQIPSEEMGWITRSRDDPALRHKTFNWAKGGNFDLTELSTLNSYLLNKPDEREMLHVIAQIIRHGADLRFENDGPVIGISPLLTAAGYSTLAQCYAWFCYSFKTVAWTFFYCYVILKGIGWIWGLKTRHDIICEELPLTPRPSWAYYRYLFYPSTMERAIRRRDRLLPGGNSSSSPPGGTPSLMNRFSTWTRRRHHSSGSARFHRATPVDEIRLQNPIEQPPAYGAKTMTIRRNPRVLNFEDRTATVPSFHPEPLPPPPEDSNTYENNT